MPESPLVDFNRIAADLGLTSTQVAHTVELADAGNTVPFITRYRKEYTGNLDEEQIRQVLARVTADRALVERASTISRLIEAQGKLTPDLARAIRAADSLKRLEDLYLPFKPKKQTRAQAARERGLGPLADQIWNEDPLVTTLEGAAKAYVSNDKQLPTTTEVLQGVHDILAEKVSEDAEVRELARRQSWRSGRLVSAAVDPAAEAAQPYRDYFQHSEAVGKIPAHRILAFNRGENASALRIKLEWDDQQVRNSIESHYHLDRRKFRAFFAEAISDSIDRLIHPSMEREVRRELTERAEEQGVAVFARNLRNLLLQPPLSGQPVLAIDPGFRTGCKIVVLDANGNLKANDLIYCTGSDDKRAGTRERLASLLRQYDCRLVAIGNGTACRETEELVAETIATLVPDVRYLIINEAGASIYSTSNAAREEFPELDATVRGTVSIGRRVQDPLSELVKIEPQHIGVGMYQHDLDAKTLRESLDQVIESCVNFVGVDLNTASAPLLSHVSGLNQLTAKRIVEYRAEHGAFQTRAQLRDVPGIGPAKYTQAAGFLKIRDGSEPLDATWIHPESYPVARKVLARLSFDHGTTGTSERDDAATTRDRLSSLDVEQLAAELQTGIPTLRDIVEALARPGRDPRADLPGPIFRQDILKLSDLTPGMELRGTILNVVDFGAFVDVGLKESGLVHISQMSTEFIRSPHDRVSVGDVVTVWVQSIDVDRKRVSLSMLPPGTTSGQRPRRSEMTPQGTPPRTPTPSTKPSGDAPSASASREPPARPSPPPASSTNRTAEPKRSPPTPGSMGTPAPPRKPAPNPGSLPLRSFDQLKDLWKERPSEENS